MGINTLRFGKIVSCDAPAHPRTIAICMDFPIAERGGVSVLVETLVEDLCKSFLIVLVSSDKFDLSGLFKHKNFLRHFTWDDSKLSRRKSRRLAEDLVSCGVTIAHFHAGNNAWRHRAFGYSPVSYLVRHEVRVFFTNHLTVSIWDGYGRAAGGSIFWKSMLFPFAWFGKLSFLRLLEAEIAVSKHDLNLLKNFYFPYRRKMRLIYHSRLREDDSPGEIKIRENLILSVGHVAFRKGQHHLVKACIPILKRHRDWKLFIVGHNAESACWEEIVKSIRQSRLEDQIFLMGAKDDVKSLMGLASIFVQPSIHEPLGLALQEAMFRGCACVGTRVGGIPEVIDGQNGILVEPGNIPQLTEVLERLVENSLLREELSQKGRSSILNKKMTREGMVKAYHALYKLS